jgi:hypothetical protein
LAEYVVKLFSRHHRFEFAVGQRECEVRLSITRAVKNANLSTIAVHASQESGDPFQWSLRRRETDALRSPTGGLDSEPLKSLEGETQMAAPFIGGHRVNFVNDHRLHVAHQIATIH